MAKIHTLPVSKGAKKIERDVAKINTRLMDENMTLKRDLAEQLKLIESLRARKTKAHRRLKALRELNRHVSFLQAEITALRAWNETLRTRLVTRTNQQSLPIRNSILRRLFNV